MRCTRDAPMDTEDDPAGAAMTYRWRTSAEVTDASEWGRGTTKHHARDTLASLRDRAARACGSTERLARACEPEVWACDAAGTPLRRLEPHELLPPSEASKNNDGGQDCLGRPREARSAGTAGLLTTPLVELCGADGKGRLLGRHANYAQRAVFLFTLPPANVHRIQVVTTIYNLDRGLQTYSWYLQNAVRFVHAINMFVQFSFLADLICNGPEVYTGVEIAVMTILFILIGLDAIKFEIEGQDEHPTARSIFTFTYNALGIAYIVLLAQELANPAEDKLIAHLSYYVFIVVIVVESFLIRAMAGLITHIFWIRYVIQLVDAVYEWRHGTAATNAGRDASTPSPEHSTGHGTPVAVSHGVRAEHTDSAVAVSGHTYAEHTGDAANAGIARAASTDASE